MKRSSQVGLVFIAMSGIVFIPFSEWITTTPIGTSLLIQFQIFYILLALVAILAAPVLIVCLFQPSIRMEAIFLLLATLILIPCTIYGFLCGRVVRMAGLDSFTYRSQPLIEAIKQFERDNSAPPATLDDLIPKYLPEVPATGMMAYPDYQYHVGIHAKEKYCDNPWALTVQTPSGGINFDMMLYLPNQKYPKNGFGGWLRPINDWAYVHE